MKILLAEDDFALSKAITTFFKIKAYQVVHYDDGDDAYDDISLDNLYDIYVIDINLPNISGLDLVKRIREIDKTVPIIIITASVDIKDLETAYDFGCSEYIKKPFNLKELNIRLSKLLNTVQNDIIITKNMKFDLISKTLFIDDEEIELRKKEIRFLEILLDNRDIKVPSETFEDYIWEGDIKESYPLRQLVNGLRRKLPCDFIKTEIGIGYSYQNCK